MSRVEPIAPKLQPCYLKKEGSFFIKLVNLDNNFEKIQKQTNKYKYLKLML